MNCLSLRTSSSSAFWEGPALELFEVLPKFLISLPFDVTSTLNEKLLKSLCVPGTTMVVEGALLSCMVEEKALCNRESFDVRY